MLGLVRELKLDLFGLVVMEGMTLSGHPSIINKIVKRGCSTPI